MMLVASAGETWHLRGRDHSHLEVSSFTNMVVHFGCQRWPYLDSQMADLHVVSSCFLGFLIAWLPHNGWIFTWKFRVLKVSVPVRKRSYVGFCDQGSKIIQCLFLPILLATSKSQTHPDSREEGNINSTSWWKECQSTCRHVSKVSHGGRQISLQNECWKEIIESKK